MSEPETGSRVTYFDDIAVGHVFTASGIAVGAEQAAEFARQYDPAYIPHPDIAYVHRGPEISPWQVAAFSGRLLSNLAVSQPIEQVVFSSPQDLEWHHDVRVRDLLRVEVEVTEIFAPDARSPDRGRAWVKVTLITTGVAGLGAWGDDDGALVDDVALTYKALMQAARRDRAPPLHDMA